MFFYLRGSAVEELWKAQQCCIKGMILMGNIDLIKLNSTVSDLYTVIYIRFVIIDLFFKTIYPCFGHISTGNPYHPCKSKINIFW